MSQSTIPFIDCHHHIWDPTGNSHPWLRADANIPFRYGDYSSIKGPYLPATYDADAHNFDVVGHVTMEGEWDDTDPVGESRWLANIFAEHPTYVGHVARAYLDRDDAETVLAGHAAFAFVKGIRHKPTAAARPDAVEEGAAGGLSDPNWQRGFAMLAAHGLHFELQAPWWHVDELIDLAAAHPETPIVINHMFMPADRSPEALKCWRQAIGRAASIPHATIKISGIGIPGRPWSVADQHDIVLDAIAAFGANRCMVASNFPVDKLCGSYDAIIGGYKVITLGLGEDDRKALFHGTADQVYRLGLTTSDAE